MTPEHISSSERQAALRAAHSVPTPTRRRGRGAIYLAVPGAGFAVMTLVLGLTSLGPAVLPAIFIPVMMVGVWASRQPAVMANTGRRLAPYWVGTGLLYAVALAVGINRFKGEPGYWVPAAILVGAPLIIGAWRESRESAHDTHATSSRR